jgi:hypothetical protein
MTSPSWTRDDRADWTANSLLEVVKEFRKREERLRKTARAGYQMREPSLYLADVYGAIATHAEVCMQTLREPAQ